MEFKNLKDELLSAVDSGLKYARKVDSEADFELYLYHDNITRVSINQGVVDASDGVVEGNAARVTKKNSVSFASSSRTACFILSKKNPNKAIRASGNKTAWATRIPKMTPE